MREGQICETLKRLRKEKIGYTQQQVADYLQVSRSTYTYYETGKTEPDLENIKKLAALFHVSLEELLGGTPQPKPLSDSAAQPNAWLREPGLNKEERQLILAYRSAAPEIRKRIEELLLGKKPEGK